MMKQKILIVGAGGFIGGFVVEEALDRGYEVWAAVRQSTSRVYLNDDRIHFVDLNYADAEQLKLQLRQLREEMGGWHYIVHNLGVTKSQNPADFERINYGYLRNLVEALMTEHLVPQQFVFMCSLGAWGLGDEKGYTPMKPTDPPRPNTQYGESKRKAMCYLQQLEGFPYVIVAPTGVYGPRERDYLLLIKAINRGIDVAVGFRPQYLTFIYVKDLVAVIFAAIDKGVKQRTYFVSDGESYSPADFKRAVQLALHKKRVLTLHVPLCVVGVAAYGCGVVNRLFGCSSTLNPDKYKIIKQRNWLCDTTQLERELNFIPRYKLTRGLEECVAWYKQEGWL